MPVINPLPRVFPCYSSRVCSALFLLLWLLPVPAFSQDKADIFVQLGHTNMIKSVAFSPDGRTLASGSQDDTVKLWDVASGRERRTLRGHAKTVNAVAFSPDGRIVASASSDHTVKLWDAVTGREIRTLSGQNSANAVAFSPDGHVLLSAHSNDYKLWDVVTGREIRAFGSTSGLATAVAFSPDGHTVVTADGAGGIKLWDAASGRELRSLRGHTDRTSADSNHISAVAFSPNGRTLVSASWDKTLKLWDAASGRERRTLRGHTAWISAVAFSPDGKKLASVGFDHTLRFWDAASGRALRTITDAQVFSVEGVTFSPDGRTVASGYNSTIRLLDAASGRELRTLKQHTAYVGLIAFPPEGRTLVTGNGVWDVSTGRQIFRTAKQIWAHATIFSPEGRTLVAGVEGRLFKLWDMASGREVQTFKGHTDGIYSVALSPDGRTAASGGADKTVRLWDVASGRERYTLAGHASHVSRVALSPDGRTAVSASTGEGLNGVLKLWDVVSGRELRTLTGHTSFIQAVTFSPDGRVLASGGDDNTVRLWDVASGRALNSLKHADWVKAVAFSPDGRTVVSGDLRGTVRLWDAASGRELRTLTGHASSIETVVFSPDGQLVASASGDRTIRIWDVTTGKERASFVSFENGEWVAITPEGYFVASEKGDQYVNVRVGNKVFGVDQYREKFYRPDLVKLALAGQALTGMASIGSVKPAPSVAIVDTPSSVGSDEATVKVIITDTGGGVGDIRLYLNGAAVVLDNTRNLQVAAKPQAGQVLSYKLRLVPGRNSVRAIAFNAENSMQSADALHEIEARFAARKPSLHALVIGIQEYENPKLTLKYPAADAKLVAATVREHAAGLFERIEITELTTRAATTKDALLKAVKEFQGRVRPDDLFVFYVASHGTVDEGEYYLITSNVGSVSTQALKRDAVSQDDLKALIANVPATKKLVVIDTCNAGKLGEAIQVAMLARGMNEETAIKILSRAVGSTILSASSSVQEALEGYEGHGLFTYVVAEGLKGKADLNRDGAVNTLELATYVDDRVPALAERVFKHKQYPLVSPSGQGFPVTRAGAR